MGIKNENRLVTILSKNTYLMYKMKILILGTGISGSIVANKLARELRTDLLKDEVEDEDEWEKF